jgi:ThiF family
VIYNRNWLFIPDDVQSAISKTTILNAGTGLGSVICELAVRTGFTKFIIADGDQVELSNLNRQAFKLFQLSENKASASACNMKNINSDVSVEVIQKFLNEDDLKALVPKADIIINTIDFDNVNFQVCTDLSRAFKKVEFFPINLGFGGALVCFDENTPSFSDYFNTKDHKILKKSILDFLILENPQCPSYLKRAYLDYVKAPRPYDPQLGISSFITSGLVVSTMVKYVSGQKIRTFPEFYHTDVENGV